MQYAALSILLIAHDNRKMKVEMNIADLETKCFRCDGPINYILVSIY